MARPKNQCILTAYATGKLEFTCLDIYCKHNPDRKDEDILSCRFEKKLCCTCEEAINEVGENIDKRWPQ